MPAALLGDIFARARHYYFDVREADGNAVATAARPEARHITRRRAGPPGNKAFHTFITEVSREIPHAREQSSNACAVSLAGSAWGHILPLKIFPTARYHDFIIRAAGFRERAAISRRRAARHIGFFGARHNRILPNLSAECCIFEAFHAYRLIGAADGKEKPQALRRNFGKIRHDADDACHRISSLASMRLPQTSNFHWF